jgi:integrase
MKGWITTRTTRAGLRCWDARWRAGTRQKSRSFQRKKDAERFLAAVVTHVHAGGYIDVKPMLMDKVFDRWLLDALEVRVAERSLSPSTAKAYRSMVEEHLRPAFGHYRSDHLTLAVVEAWRAGVSAKIARGAMSPKFYTNQRNLLHAICDWARHPGRQFLAQDPLSGLPKVRLSRSMKRTHFEPDQVAALLARAATTPPNDTIIRVAALSGLRRSELFALQWSDLEVTGGTGQLHVRRRLYQGDLNVPKTDGSDRVVDVPQRLLDEFTVYRELYPPIGEGFIFRQASGSPLDPDNWHHRQFVPLLKAAGLYRRGTGLHVLRHSYVSLLIALGEDVGYIADQVGHSTTRLTQDIYRHLFTKTRTEAMRRLHDATSFPHPAKEETR